MASLNQIGYSVHLSTAGNVKQKIIKDFVSLEYTRSVNTPGSMTLTIAASTENRALVSDGQKFRRDMRLEVWRLLGAREYLEMDTQWISRQIEMDDDQETINIRADSGLTLLSRRIIAYDAGTSNASKTGPADDIIVEFVNENIGSAATDSNRDWSSLITVRPSPGNGVSVTKSASRRNLLTTIQDIAKQASIQGVPIFFDMNYLFGSKTFEFRTYSRQRGVDLTAGTNQLVFSTEYNNLTRQVRSDDFSSEATYVYAAGQGQASERVVVTASDGGRIVTSPFGRIEALVDSRNTVNTAALTSDAEAALRNNRPVRKMSGIIINKPGAEYGLDWLWGDRIKLEYYGQVFTARIDTVSVRIEGGQEIITADLRIED